MYYPKILSLIFLSFIFFDKIKDTYQKFSRKNYFHKVYVHTDKNFYTAGEKIWFSAYAFDVKNQKILKNGHLLYVELINNEKKIIASKIFKLNGYVSYNYFDVADTFNTGYYLIRAYTDVMRNYPEQYFFKKEIFIKTSNLKFNRDFWYDFKKSKKSENKIFVNVYSETGKFVKGLNNHILVKVVDYHNNPIDGKVAVKYLDTTKLFELKNGLADFYFDFKNDLILKVITDKKVKKVKIKPLEFFYSLASDIDSQNVVFNFYSLKNDSIYLFGEINGKIHYLNSFFTKDSLTEIKISKKNLPEGIIRFLFFDKNGNFLFERLIYNSFSKALYFNVKTFTKNDTLFFDFKKNFNSNDTFYLSISVLNFIKNDWQNIVNEYFINSDLSNKLDFSIYPLDDKFINLYLISETWEKYHWENFIKQSQIKDFHLKYLPQEGIFLKGYVSSILEGIPAKNVPVYLRVLNTYNDEFYTETDRKGRFVFENLQYYDSIEFILKSNNRQGKKYVGVSVDLYDTINPNFDNVGKQRLENYRYKYLKTPKRREYHRTEGTLHSRADQVIYFDDQIRASYSNVLDVLKSRAVGFYDQSTVHFRGYHSFNLSSEPLYLIDNIPVDVEAVRNMNIYDVDRVEIIRSSSAIYGSRGANGVIAVYTTRGYNIIWGKYQGKFQGLSKNVNFVFQNVNNPLKTLYWKPALKIYSDTLIKVLLPIETDTIFLDIQGVSTNLKFFYLQKKIK